jgi:hypothetical protein
MDKLKFQLETADLTPILTQIISKAMEAQMDILLNKLKEILPDFNQITYTRTQFAKRLNISPKTLHDWLNKGKVQSQSYSNVGLFTHADLENLLKNPLYKPRNKKKKSYDIDNIF